MAVIDAAKVGAVAVVLQGQLDGDTFLETGIVARPKTSQSAAAVRSGTCYAFDFANDQRVAESSEWADHRGPKLFPLQ
jgi:hypothetical protein